MKKHKETKDFDGFLIEAFDEKQKLEVAQKLQSSLRNTIWHKNMQQFWLTFSMELRTEMKRVFNNEKT